MRRVKDKHKNDERERVEKLEERKKGDEARMRNEKEREELACRLKELEKKLDIEEKKERRKNVQ